MSETNHNSSPSGHAHVLVYVVDDEPMLLELAEVILQPLGYKIVTYRDPALAYEDFAKAVPRPNLLVTDYAMHSMNGMQLIEKCRELEPNQKILLVSGTVGEEIFSDATVKPDEFLAKPYQAEELTSLVKKLALGR